jgi:UDP-glucose 4-epimerase
VYGPGELVDSHMAAVIGKWRHQSNNGEPLTIVGNGYQRRDFTYIDDIIDGLIRVAETDKTHEDAWELGTGNNYEINEVAQMFVDKFGCKITHIPNQQGNYAETIRVNDDAIQQLGWQPTDRLEKYIKSL